MLLKILAMVRKMFSDEDEEESAMMFRPDFDEVSSEDAKADIKETAESDNDGEQKD